MIFASFLSLIGTAALAAKPFLETSARTTVQATPQFAAPTPTVQGTTGGDAQPRTRAAARTAAAAALDAYTDAEYGEFWDTWSREAQRQVPRRDYVRLFELCPQTTTGVPFRIERVTITGNRAKVRTTRRTATYTFDFLHQDGTWRFLPSPGQRREYARDPKQVASEKRAKGQCGDG